MTTTMAEPLDASGPASHPEQRGVVELGAERGALERLIMRIRRGVPVPGGLPSEDTYWHERLGETGEGWEGIPGETGTVVIRVIPLPGADGRHEVTVGSLQDLEPIHPHDSELRQRVRRFQFIVPAVAALVALVVSVAIAPRETFDLFVSVTTVLVGLIALFSYWPACNAAFGLNKMVWGDVASDHEVATTSEALTKLLEASPQVRVVESLRRS